MTFPFAGASTASRCSMRPVIFWAAGARAVDEA